MGNRNDPYYLGNCDRLPTKIIFKTTDTTIEQTLHWDATLNDALSAVYAGLIGIGFTPYGILDGMGEFITTHEDREDRIK